MKQKKRNTQNRSRQFELFENKSLKHFGGAHLQNSNAKVKRPISTTKAMHLVMRSLIAKGDLSFSRKQRELHQIIDSQGQSHGVKVYRRAIASNHLHLIVLPRSRQAFIGFLRALTGLIARLMQGKQRGAAQPVTTVSKESFWEKRPFTRIVEWGRDFQGVCRYVLQNTLEAVGFIPFQPRKKSRQPRCEKRNRRPKEDRDTPIFSTA